MEEVVEEEVELKEGVMGVEGYEEVLGPLKSHSGSLASRNGSVGLGGTPPAVRSANTSTQTRFKIFLNHQIFV